MTPEHVLCWSSSIKPVMAVALGLLCEAGHVTFDDAVCKHITGFAARGKERATVANCLTHQVGLWGSTQGLNTKTLIPPARVLAHICRQPPMEGWEEPGQRCGYDSPAWFVLGGVVTAADPKSRPYEQYVEEEIFAPLGLGSSSVGMTRERYDSLETAGLLAPIYLAPMAKAKDWRLIHREEDADFVRYPDPSGNGRGPAKELAAIYGALLSKSAAVAPSRSADDTGDSARTDEPAMIEVEPAASTPAVAAPAPQLLRESTVELITKTAREGVVDELQGVDTAWSLGFALRSILSGRYASTRAFGHGGSQSSHAFADPEYGLAVACLCNGKPGPDLHYRRVGAVSTAVYEDLGLAAEGGSSRTFKLPAGLGTF